ncbi:hypothetical protein BJF78_10510 [Pseudonocardia sp. CNS-139]|nr:hypothetical protein BJF78_10510 [Pseudonocardia sp. CNS-139]
MEVAAAVGSRAPEVAGLVTTAVRVAEQVASGYVMPHHIAAAAMGGVLAEPAIPPDVLAVLGVDQRQLRDALRDAIAQSWPGESADAWTRVWEQGEKALRGAAPSVRRYADVHNDAEATEDRLGITADVEAMAALLAATSTTPPLSVALMGNWGSGKSTFMALVQQRVAALSAAAAADPESRFAPVIRQVRFNAWHYSDDHVWVGLIEHLFRGLREAAPATGDDAVPELEAKLKAAQSRQAKLDDELVRIDELDPDQGWWGWLWEPRRFALVVRAAGRQAVQGAPWRRVLVGLLWLVAVAAVVAGGAYGWQWASGLAVVSAALALLAPVVSAWRRARELAATAHTKLVADKKQVAAEIVQLEQKLDAADPVRGLKALVEELNTGDRYRSYRGLTGQIHEDLRRLDEQLGGLGRRERQRIVLYVDDLDRCTSTRVVEVLQAVNLLLSMPLFVVVVAVDPRWLITAIEDRHGKDARPLDYLDKIFHIPFAVRPMHDRASEYLRSLLPPVEAVEDEPAAPVAPAVPDAERVAPEPRPAPRPAPAVPEPPVARAEERLRIRAAEAAFLPEVAALLETPRAVKKAVNLYLLLRATVADADLDDFLGDEHGGPFQAAALLVAGIVGDPARAEQLLSAVIAAKPDAPIGPVLPDGPLAALVDGFAQRYPLLGEVAAYQRWARTVARYSFQSYALFGDAASPASPASA